MCLFDYYAIDLAADRTSLSKARHASVIIDFEVIRNTVGSTSGSTCDASFYDATAMPAYSSGETICSRRAINGVTRW